MKSCLLWIVQVFCLLWFLWWGLVLLSPFNKYGDLSILDCDSDTEFFIGLGIFAIWFATVLIVAVSGHVEFWQKYRELWFISGIGFVVSLAALQRCLALVHYTHQIQEYCDW